MGGMTQVDQEISAIAVPAAASERIASLDFIRGIAVLGILFANIVAFGHSLPVYYWPEAMPGGATVSDRLVWLFQFILIDHKMRGLFTLLFGAGMMLFMEKAWARGETRWLQLRRLLWLLLFGAMHFYFIWFGDILQLYAVWGMIALMAMRWSARKQLIAGLLLYAFGTVAMAVAMGSQYYIATHPQSALVTDEARLEILGAEAKELAKVSSDMQLFQNATYPDFVHHQIFEMSKFNLTGQAFGLFETIGLIMLGMALYRYGFFSGALDPRRMQRLGWAGLTVGAALSAVSGLIVFLEGFPYLLTLFVFQGTMMLPRLAFVMGLAALLVVWAPRATQTWLGVRLVAAGRMAFSNYLGTSIIMLFLFHGWALGLYGRLHRFELFLVVLAIWAAMLLGSKFWLERFRFGPLEWLWRCLTYWRVFPIRR